ncbi:MAG: hypothetical protein LBH05_03890 [Deferribacteraceae bacterium]|nr:hypothetical protein [Deferribacteraceae bacterium]
MKKLGVLIIVCLCFVVIGNAYAKCQYNLDVDASVRDGLMRPATSYDPLDGTVCSNSFFYGLQVIPYKNGLAEGIAKAYSKKSGKLRYEVPYKNGKKEGIEKTYYESGQLREECTYENNQLVGDCKLF